jgi:hypothetical protein
MKAEELAALQEAKWRNALTLTDPEKGEGKAHDCDIAFDI